MSRRKKRQVFENLTVTDAGAKGKAVAHAPDGRVVFISNAVPGDVVTVQTTKKRKSYYEGQAIGFSAYSDKRVEAPCVHFGTCGGCKWQFMGYEHQLFYKQQEVQNNLTRLGGIQLPEIDPILGSKNQYYYRNKMEFSFSDSKWLTKEQIDSGEEIPDRHALGFHIPGMWDKILDLSHCHLQRDPSNAIRNYTKEAAIELGMSFYNRRRQDGLLRTLMIRTSSTGELMVLVQFYYQDPAIGPLLDRIQERFPEITSLLYVINGKGNDTIYDQEVLCHAGRDHIWESMEDLKFKIDAKSFYQTNSEQAFELYKLTREMAGLTGNERVYDLYTGTGTIALFVAKQAKEVIGIELVPEAIEAAKANALENGVSNTRFYAGDMKALFKPDFIDANGRPDVVITDPPRDGMHGDVVKQLLELGAPRIVYVSCNSATQARDLALMDEMYEVKRVQPVDMFPQTAHCENIVLLEKRNLA